MKTTLLAAVAAIALSTAPAFAESAITTQTPPTPDAQSFTPQPGLGVPPGSATATTPRAGDEIASTRIAPAPVAGRDGGSRAGAAAL